MAENKKVKYDEENIKTLEWHEHIRIRPGMYIGKLGDGQSHDDGIYILLKEVIDNSIDEFVMGNGNKIEVKIQDGTVNVRDYGRGVPQGKIVDVVSKMNTGAKYDSQAFQKSVGLNGVGTKAVNALSSSFRIESFREGKAKHATFSKGLLQKESGLSSTTEPEGTLVTFIPDDTVFTNYHYLNEFVERMLWNYAYLNTGLTILYNDKVIKSDNGLYDLLVQNISETPLYPIVHIKGHDIEVALTHGNGYGEEYYSFVNGQHTTQGGTHQQAFREAFVQVVRNYFKKDYDAVDIRTSIIAAVSVRVQEPVFESQTKTKLGSVDVGPQGPTMKAFINDFLKTVFDNYLHKNPEVTHEILTKILQSERERKELSGIKKLARERAKKASLHNKKLRDCRVHLTDSKDTRNLQSTLFICEGDSASGSITKVRDVNAQAVFSLKGKPLNVYGKTKKIVYENEEFNLLQAALDIEDDYENLRYNNIVLATDADVDGMHIRLLLITFFAQFFPELIRANHVYILQTPLFRVRNKKETIYCYSDTERVNAIKKLGGKPEITRFKGLGEISPDEFKNFIGKDMRLDPVIITKETSLEQLMSYYMGDNTMQRQEFIIQNLRVENEETEEEELDVNVNEN